MSKHTTGPWILDTVITSSSIGYKIGPFPPSRKHGKPRYACLYAEHPADQELLANARLIAAAPDLLEAVRAFHKATSQSQFDDAITLASAAILKATGESK